MSCKFEHFEGTALASNRQAERNAVHIIAELRLPVGQRFKVSVLDLSQTGFRIETGNHIELGSRVYLAIPELQSLPAQIAWSGIPFYGCAFLNPLYSAVFEHVAQKYPTITR